MRFQFSSSSIDMQKPSRLQSLDNFSERDSPEKQTVSFPTFLIAASLEVCNRYVPGPNILVVRGSQCGLPASSKNVIQESRASNICAFCKRRLQWIVPLCY